MRARAAGDLFSRRHLVKLVDLAGSLPDYVEETPRELDHLIPVRGFEQRVAADDLFRLSKGAVSDRDLASRALMHANACGTEMHALGCDQPTRLHALLDELAHCCHFGLRQRAINGFVCENADEAQCLSSWV